MFSQVCPLLSSLSGVDLPERAKGKQYCGGTARLRLALFFVLDIWGTWVHLDLFYQVYALSQDNFRPNPKLLNKIHNIRNSNA